MPENSYIKPTRPFQYHLRVDEDKDETKTPIHRKRAIICLGCCMSGILLLAVVMIVLMLTVFHIKSPVLTLNRITVSPSPSRIYITEEVAVKNPNIAEFKYGNSTTFVYYHGDLIGEIHTPSGVVPARRKISVNVVMEMNTSSMANDSRFKDKIGDGILRVETYTMFGGRVKIAGMIKKNFDIRMNCSVLANVTSQKIVERKCESKVSI